jgi:hypothetical protein
MKESSPSRLNGHSPRCLPNRLAPTGSTFTVFRSSSTLRREPARLIPTIQNDAPQHTVGRRVPVSFPNRFHSFVAFGRLQARGFRTRGAQPNMTGNSRRVAKKSISQRQARLAAAVIVNVVRIGFLGNGFFKLFEPAFF